VARSFAISIRRSTAPTFESDLRPPLISDQIRTGCDFCRKHRPHTSMTYIDTTSNSIKSTQNTLHRITTIAAPGCLAAPPEVPLAVSGVSITTTTTSLAKIVQPTHQLLCLSLSLEPPRRQRRIQLGRFGRQRRRRRRCRPGRLTSDCAP
jgi:hypothetical protein